MEINYSEKDKKQKYLIFVFVGVLFITFIIIWQNYLVKPETPGVLITEESKLPTIIINFETLKNPIFKELQPFEDIQPFNDKIGRDNPFTPY